MPPLRAGQHRQRSGKAKTTRHRPSSLGGARIKRWAYALVGRKALCKAAVVDVDVDDDVVEVFVIDDDAGGTDVCLMIIVVF